MVRTQEGVDLRLDPGDRPDKLIGGGVQAVADQLLQVLHVVPEGGQLDHHRGQPVEQVPAEGVFRNGLEGVLVARGDHPHIQPQVLTAPHPAEGLLLEDPQNFGLHGQAHGVQLVQKEGAPGGLLQIARLVLTAGEAALFGTEEEAFNQRFRDGGAVDGQEFASPAAAGPVDALGENLLARPRLPHQEDGAVLGGHPLGQGHRLPQLGAAADHVVKGIAGKADVRRLVLKGAEGPPGGLQLLDVGAHDVRRLLKDHRPQQLPLPKNGVGGVGRGDGGGAEVIGPEAVHPVDHRGLGLEGGHGGADALVQVVQVQKVPPLYIDPAGDAGDAPAGPVEEDGAGVFVIDLHPVGDLVQSPGQEIRPLVHPLEQQPAGVLRGGEDLKGKGALLPDKLSAGRALGEVEGGVGHPAAAGPALKEVPIQVLSLPVPPGDAAKAPLGVQGEQNVVEHSAPSPLQTLGAQGPVRFSLPEGGAVVKLVQCFFAICK